MGGYEIITENQFGMSDKRYYLCVLLLHLKNLSIMNTTIHVNLISVFRSCPLVCNTYAMSWALWDDTKGALCQICFIN